MLAVIGGAPMRRALIEAAKGAELLGAASLPWEVGNALSALLGRRRGSLVAVRAAAAAYREIPLRLIDVDLAEALELSARLGIHAHDAYPIVCARMAHCPLATLDAALAKVARGEGIPVVEVQA